MKTLTITAGCFLVMFFLLVHTARSKSMTYDEIIYPAMGLLYWETGNLRWNKEHPPLQKLVSAAPLLTQKVTIPANILPTTHDPWRTGYMMFFASPTSAATQLFLSRLPTIL